MPDAFEAHPLAERFARLTPDQVMAAAEVDGRTCTGRFVVLNSYENRVFELDVEDDDGRSSAVIGKFYRPGRWSIDALDDEHDFIYALDDADVPVGVPLALDDDGATIGTLTGEAAGIHYAIYPKVRGRVPDEFRDDELRTLGRLLAELHDVGADDDAPHRPTLDVDTYARQNLAYLVDHGHLPPEIAKNYAYTVDALCDRIEPRWRDLPLHRIHGDCHPGNLIRTGDSFTFVDFDDMLTGPAVQDVWMLVPSYDAEGARQRDVLLDGYREVRDFPAAWLELVEPLRALRYIRYATWIARRWHDPIFKRTFAHFGDLRYWQREVMDLREQIARIDTR